MKDIFLYFSLFRSCSFLCLSIPVYYFPYFLFLFLPLSVSLSVFYFLSCCLPSFSSDFLYLSSSTFSFCFCLFLSLLFISWLSSTSFLCLSSIIFPLPSSLSFRVCVRYHYYYPVLFFIFSTYQFFSTFSTYFSTFFFLFCFSYFVLFSTIFDYLVLILDFNYFKFSLLFIFHINLCYLFPFSLAVFFT